MVRRVLIIDDSAVIRKQARTHLSELGYEVFEAVDGEDALVQVDKHKQSLDFIFCDITMPKMDGLTFLERVKELGYQIPTVMMTAESSAVLTEKAKSLGALGWIIKPTSPEVLDGVIKKITQKRKKNA